MAAQPAADSVADEFRPRDVLKSERSFEGRVWDVRTDEVDLGHERVTRDYVAHPGAVAIIALDDEDRVAMVRQYRHPVRHDMWEPPAGLLDVAGEPPVEAAKRELYEEADLTADEWHLLLDVFTSPGGSSEWIRVFLARGLHEVPEAERFERDGEEAEMVRSWVPLDDAAAAVTDGRLMSPTTVSGILAAHLARERGWSSLREVGAPIPQRP